MIMESPFRKGVAGVVKRTLLPFVADVGQCYVFMSSDHIDQPCVTVQSVVCHNFSLFAAKIVGVSAKNKQTTKNHNSQKVAIFAEYWILVSSSFKI
jgi:hypothetical protein